MKPIGRDRGGTKIEARPSGHAEFASVHQSISGYTRRRLIQDEAQGKRVNQFGVGPPGTATSD